jgi:ribosomal protein L40E
LSTDTELTLKQGERWEIQTSIVLPSNANSSLGQFENSLEETVSGYQSQGIQASWKVLPQEQGITNISYQVQMAGIGYQLLNQTLFGGQAVVSISKDYPNVVEFHYLPSNFTFDPGQQNSFRLTSTKIVESNGLLLDDSSVTWTDPSGILTARVSVAPDRTLIWVTLLGLGGIGLLIAGLGLSGKLPSRYLLRIPTKTDHLAIPSSSGFETKYCLHCGALNPEEAEFCTKCGTEFTT